MPEKIDPSFKYAGFMARAMALGIDILLIHLLYFCCLAAVTVVLWAHAPHWLALFSSLLFSLLLFLLTFPLFVLVYFLALHGWQGQTIGKMFMGLQVVRADGAEMTPGIAFLRFIGFWLSLIPLGLGFFWTIIDREKCAWHDHLASTRVIMKISALELG